MKTLVDKIKKEGYWKVVIRPMVFKENLIKSIGECKELIKSCQISLRGWNYPHIDKSGIKISGNNNIESCCDWEEGGMFEYWRFYQSGQFAHYFAMREDYELSEENIKQIHRHYLAKSQRFLSILSTLYSVTEIFAFSQHLAEKNALGDSVEILIELGNVEGRELFFWNSFSRHLSSSYICGFRDENILVRKILTKEDLISSSDRIALDACMEIFDKFDWGHAPKQLFEEEQKKFLERRI